MRFVKGMMLLSVMVLLSTVPALAIDVAIPSDMYGFTWTGQPGLVSPGVTVMAQWAEDRDLNMHRGYGIAIDESGEIVRYIQNEHNVEVSYWDPQDFENRHIYTLGFLGNPAGAVITDSAFVPLDTIPRWNPYNNEWKLDLHEVFYDSAGGLWTHWSETRIYDMSQYINGGHPECEVSGDVIQKWDENGNLLWEWKTLDHLDELPFMATNDTTELYEESFNHLHMNAYSMTPDGDLLLSLRKVNVMALVDFPSGEIEWIMGGGILNQFTITGDADGHPLDFNRQHDCWLWPDGNVTVFDNGNLHPTPRSYAREYSLDFDTMTAELVWYYVDPDTFDAGITGSVRKLSNGNRLICWGARGALVSATELTPNNDVVWEVVFDGHDPIVDSEIKQYRAQKVTHLAPAAYPQVTEVIDHDLDQVELVCNWWGHEDEVSGYEIWWGQDENNLALHGSTMDDGFYYIVDYNVTELYYTQIRALNADGAVISDYSPVWKVNTNPLDVEELQVAPEMPRTITLAPAYPNPFNARTNVNILLPQPSNVELQVFDVLGRRVTELHQGRLNAGEHMFTFDARNLSSGVYFIRAFTPGDINQVQRVVLIK